MKMPVVFAVVLLGLISVQLVEACGPWSPHPFEISTEDRKKNRDPVYSDAFSRHFSHLARQLQLGYPPLLSIVELGARRGMDECQNQFNESWRLNCSTVRKLVDPEFPVFVNTTLPLATRETAFIHAISSAAIAYELTLRCRHNIRKCKCVKRRDLKGCGDNFEFGQNQTERFFQNLEKGHGARTAVNLHNNKVGRKVVNTSQNVFCRCFHHPGFNFNCVKKKCYPVLAPFKLIGSELKQKYHNAVRVWFSDGKLYERNGDQFKAISSEDNRLVYLDPSPDFCVRKDTLGTPGMLGRTCRSNNVTKSDCETFKALCSSCKFRYETKEYFKQYKCNCKFIWCCHVECQTCTNRAKKYSVTTCFANREQRAY